MTRIWIFAAGLMLAGCGESETTLLQLCQENKQMCEQLWDDSHCKAERRTVLFSRVSEAKLPSDNHKYQLLMDFEKYQKCMEVAAGIEHIKLKEKTTARLDNVLFAQQEIKRLSDETVASPDPGLTFWHWSRNHSSEHQAKFLQSARNGELKRPELLLAYGQYMKDRQPDEAITNLLAALKAYRAGDKVDPDIYTGLTSIYFKKKNYPACYLWALVAEQAGVERIEFQVIVKDLAEQVDRAKLKELASQTLQSIEAGQFKAPVI